MSDWGAIQIGGEAISAWEFRAIYLKFGIRYDRFSCPFCDIRLAGYLIDADGEISKSPHFSARWEDHLQGCDGEPIPVQEPVREPAKDHYGLRGMRFPEAFTDRPVPRASPSQKDVRHAPPSEAEIQARRKRAGPLGIAKPKTYLLRPIVEAYNMVVKEGFDMVRDGTLKAEERNAWTKRKHQGMGLCLANPSNYANAFRTPRFIDRRFPQIYHETGKLAVAEGLFVLQSEAEGDDGSSKAPFRVVVDPAFVTQASPKSHHAILAKLRQYHEGAEKFRWYAYGQPITEGEAFVLRAESLDYLYFKDAH